MDKQDLENKAFEDKFYRCPYIELGCAKFDSMCMAMDYDNCRWYDMRVKDEKNNKNNK